jgi:hypothetical protein
LSFIKHEIVSEKVDEVLEQELGVDLLLKTLRKFRYEPLTDFVANSEVSVMAPVVIKIVL